MSRISWRVGLHDTAASMTVNLYYQSTRTHSHVMQVQVQMALTVDDFADVQSALWGAKRKWFNIGIRLGLKVNTLQDIDHDKDSLEDKLTAMILCWLNLGEQCTWKALEQALKHQTVDLPELALKMKTNHGSHESESYFIHCIVCVYLVVNAKTYTQSIWHTDRG